MTFWRGVALGSLRSPFKCGSRSVFTKLKNAPKLPIESSSRLAPLGAAQSRQRYEEASEGTNAAPTASAASASPSSRSSRIRKKSIQVSSGIYCKALAQLDRRRMPQMDQILLFSDCWVKKSLPFPFLRD